MKFFYPSLIDRHTHESLGKPGASRICTVKPGRRWTRSWLRRSVDPLPEAVSSQLEKILKEAAIGNWLRDQWSGYGMAIPL